MSSLLIPLLLLAASVPLVVGIMRINELFVVRTFGGRLRVVRGKVPQALLNDLADVIGNDPARNVELRGMSEDGRVRLYPRGELDEGEKQRLRNVAAQWPVVRVRNG